MEHVEYRRGEYVISTDSTRLDVSTIHKYLSHESYWAQGRTKAEVATSISNSLCFGLYANDGSQVGFARIVTDQATFAWLCDVFVLDAHRGRGLAKWLIETVVRHPVLRSLPRILLATRDAHTLYSKYGGFEILPNPDRWMVRLAPNPGLDRSAVGAA